MIESKLQKPPSSTTEGITSDRSLVVKFRGGNEEAATQLYQRYAMRLRALVKSKCSSQLARRVEAEDIIQSVFRSFFRAARQGLYDAPAGDDLWNLLLVIALNKIRAEGNFHRAAKRDVRQTSELDALDSHLDFLLKNKRGSNFLDVVLRDTLEQLPKNHQQIVYMRMEGRQVAEIAERIGRSKRSVERILQETRGKLRTLLEAEELQ